MGDFHAPNSGNIITCVKSAPLAVQINLHVRMEIHWGARVPHADVGKMSRDVTSGNVDRPAKRYGHVGEVTANAVSSSHDFRGRNIRPARPGDVPDVMMDPIGNRNYAVQAIDNPAKLIRGKFLNLIGITVSTGQKIAKDTGGKLPDENGFRSPIKIVSHVRDLNQCIVRDRGLSRWQLPSFNGVACPVPYFFISRIGTDRQTLGGNELRFRTARANDQENRSGINRLVDEATPNSYSELGR